MIHDFLISRITFHVPHIMYHVLRFMSIEFSFWRAIEHGLGRIIPFLNNDIVKPNWYYTDYEWLDRITSICQSERLGRLRSNAVTTRSIGTLLGRHSRH